ncbi:MAG: PspA/IM30 family protein [Chloroflexi bacterium]|nr:MAG: PspA/IM30 family protein [Chloroflexota bacterium]
MSIFRRFSNVVQQKANAAADRLEDPGQALDLSYEKLLEEQQRMRRALVDATTGQKRLENQAADLDARVARLNGQAQAAVQQSRDDLATQALTQASVLQAQRDALTPQLATIQSQVAKLQTALQKYQARLTAFQSQRDTLKAQYVANQAVSQAGESLAGIGEHINDTSLMITRAQDKIAGMQAHADAVDSLLDSGVLDQPGLGGSALDAQLQVTAMENDVQAKLAALKAQAKLPAPAAAAAPALGEAGIVIRIHGEGQFRLDASLRDPLDTYDHTLVAAVRAGDDAAYHAALAELFTFVRDKGIRVPADDILSSDIVLPSDDMTLAEVTDLLAREAWLELNSTS